MRCPKCGYNSFDHLDSCKKCGKDLSEHKQRFGIVSVLFPGQMQPVDKTVAPEDESVVDDAVAAATATTATAGAAVAAGATAAADAFAVEEPAATEASESDDFGFDFMGDSEEEEDLSFDELFEEAPADEDVEETLPSPEKETAEASDDEFAFDLEDDEGVTEGSDLADDFGFDPADIASDDEEVLVKDQLDLPPEDKDDFSFESDDEEAAGAKEDPKDPFDLPGFSQEEEAPEESLNLFTVDPVVGDEDDLLSSESPSAVVAEPEQEVADAFADSLFTEPLEATAPFAEEPDPDVTPAEPFAEHLPLAENAAAENPPAEPTGEWATTVAESAEVLAASAPFAAVAATGTVAAAESLAEDADRSAPAETGLLPATGSRVAAFFCDLLLLVIVGTSFVIAAEAAISGTSDGLLPSLETLIDLSVPYFLVLFSLAFGYFTLFHFLAGQTPGKMLAGLRVETLAGEPLLFSQAFLRSVGGLLQALPVGLGYLAILSSPERRGWNDQLAGTRLISLRGLSEEL